MGLAIGDYDRNGTIDIFKTNFAGDTSTLYANTGDGLCEDRTFASGVGINTRWLGWGVGFLDVDHDGWLDLFLVNGHVYPEVEQIRTEAGYRQRKVLYRNLRNGRFEDLTERLGAPLTTPRAGRGAAFGDFDNDGDVDVAVNNVHDTPNLYRLDLAAPASWTELKLVGSTSNRSAIGARVRIVSGGITFVREVRGGGSYYSQNDLRVHAGLGGAAGIERVEVRWPNGNEEVWKDVPVRKIVTLVEGKGDGSGEDGERLAHDDRTQSSQSTQRGKPLLNHGGHRGTELTKATVRPAEPAVTRPEGTANASPLPVRRLAFVVSSGRAPLRGGGRRASACSAVSAFKRRRLRVTSSS